MLDPADRERVTQAFMLLRQSGDRVAARSFVLAEIRKNDEALLKYKARPHGHGPRREDDGLVRIELAMLFDLIAAEWPDLGVDLLSEAAINPWRARLVGGIAKHSSHRAAMVRRAFDRYPSNDEIVRSFAATAAQTGDRELLDAARRLLGDKGSALDFLVWAYDAFGDKEAAMALAIRAVGEHQTRWRVLLRLVEHGYTDLPQAALEALARLPGDVERGSMVTELRAAGAPKAADRLSVMLSGSASGPQHPLALAMRLVLDDPASALTLAEEAMRQPPAPGTQMRTELELVKFLRLVRLDAATAPRVLALAQFIQAQPVRMEIVAQTEAHLAS